VGVVGGDVSASGVEPHAQDPEAAARLWTLSEEWVGQKLEA
jgi:hypothetical protein